MDPDVLVYTALHTISPRPAFSDALLRSLAERPVVLVPVADEAARARKVRVVGAVAAGAGFAGATAYTIARRFRRKGAR